MIHLRKQAVIISLLTCVLMLGAASNLYGQNNPTVSGQVVGAETMEPLPGVNVLVKGTTMGTATDADGNYLLEVSSLQDTLVFSFVGFQTKTIPIRGRTNIDIVLESQAITGEELVVVGYGTQESSQVTYAISSVSGEDIASSGTVSPMDALQGQVAGAVISANSGLPGTGYSIKIRGQNSLAGGEPLYVVDGVITQGISFLNPQSIAKINILKDAASTAIYGSRGSNGVVIVTTKNANQVGGETTITYDAYVGIRKNVRMPDFMNGTEWWEFRQNAYITDALQNNQPYDETIGGVAQSELLARRLANKNYTYWPGYFLQDGFQTNHWLSVSGASESGDMRYVIGAGYQKERGNMEGQLFNRYNFKASITHDINDVWSAGLNFNLSVSERELSSEDAIRTAYRMSPLVNPYDSTGALLFKPAKYAGIGFTSSVNPLWEMKDSKRTRRRTYGVGSIYLQFSPLDWLEIRSTFAPSFEFEREGLYLGPHTEERQLQDAAAQMEKGQSISYTWDNQISVFHQYKKHHFDALGLFSIYYDRAEGSSIEVANLPYNSLYYNLGTASNYQDVGSRFSKTTLMSYMFRLNYSYANKYLATVVMRWDGSSKLAQGYKWASFPSVSVGWRISEEDFLNNIKAVSELKLRFSYGYSGNNNISPYTTLPLSNVQTIYDFGGELAKGFAPNGLVNQRLTWEKTREFDIGLDFGLFANRITGSIDYYNKLSKKLLMDRQLPLETGWESLTDNVGSVRNTGIEIALQTLNIRTKDFSWQTSFTFAANHNEIVELYGGREDDVGNAWFIGEPINVNYTYVFDGIWKDNAAAQQYGQTRGEARVKDLNNDGVIDGADRAIIGTPAPSWTGGFSTQIRYKGFDLSATLYTRQGVQVFSPFHEEFLDMDDRGRAKLDVNYYMPPNKVTPTRQSNSYPQPHNSGPYWDEVGSYKDASFVKVQNIVLGYNFPQDLVQKINIKSLRVYLNVMNPFVWTDYTGFDPEWAASDIDESGNSFITYQLGVNLKF